jgi:tetratricopeptide (TPR) repeat protein
MRKKKGPVRDIYHSRERDLDKDFTQQIATEQQAERMRDLRRARLAASLTGVVLLAIVIAVILIVSRSFLPVQPPPSALSENGSLLTPEYALTVESLWVMDYQQTEAPQDDESTDSNAPSIGRLKEAAYRIFLGQQTSSGRETMLEEFRKALEIYPDIRDLHGLMGLLHLQNNEYKPAAEHLEKALQEQTTFDVLNQLGTAYAGLEEYDKAENVLKQALEMRSEYPDCHKRLAGLYRKMKRADEAVYHFQKYTDMQPNDLDARQDYGLYLTQLGRWTEAADLLTQLTREMTDVAPVYFLLAQAQIQNKQPALAIAALTSGVQLIDPKLALNWMNRDELAPLRNVPEFKALLEQVKTKAASADQP